MSGIPSGHNFLIDFFLIAPPSYIDYLRECLPFITDYTYTRIAHFLIGCWILEVKSETHEKGVPALHIHSDIAEIF